MSTSTSVPTSTECLVRSVGRAVDPLALYEALTGGTRDTLLLESGDRAHAEKSLVVCRSALRITARGRRVTIDALNPNGASLLPAVRDRIERSGRGAVEPRPAGLAIDYPSIVSASAEERLKAPAPPDALRAVLSIAAGEEGSQIPPPLLAGVFSYDFIDSFETLPEACSDRLLWPDYEFWLPDQMVWISHRLLSTRIAAYVFAGEHASRVRHDAVGTIARIVASCEGLPVESQLPAGLSGGRLEAASPPRRGAEVNIADDEFERLVETLQSHIRAGDVFQIVVSRSFSAPCDDPLGAYRRLRALNPSPHMFFVSGTAGVLFGASPESALSVDERRRVFIQPIAGTRPRGRRADGTIDADLDSRLETELRLDEKELAEHLMLVDLARNDVAHVSEPGSRSVDRLLMIARYSHVMHLVSGVSGALRRDLDPLHAYVATMNMGTLTGAPKVKAASLLRQYEPERRGPYGGAVGYLTADGRMDTAIVIRAAVVANGMAQVRAGAGIVFDSNPAAEAMETRSKAEAVLRAIRGGEA
jgi:anthranilate synthase component 1